MTEQLISFETAKLAEEKGFAEHTNCSYNETDGNDLYEEGVLTGYIAAPTQSLLQKWLREKHLLTVEIISDVNIFWNFRIGSLGPAVSYPGQWITSKCSYKTYEKALEAGLIEVLKLI